MSSEYISHHPDLKPLKLDWLEEWERIALINLRQKNWNSRRTPDKRGETLYCTPLTSLEVAIIRKFIHDFTGYGVLFGPSSTSHLPSVNERMLMLPETDLRQLGIPIPQRGRGGRG